MNEAKICLVVNPVAGLGGPLGWKGTSEEEGRRLLREGVRPSSHEKAVRFLAKLNALCGRAVRILTASGYMGEYACRDAGIHCEVIYVPTEWPTRSADTYATVSKCVEQGVDVIVFVGGDGTARIVSDAARGLAPIIGVPAGVKMYSSIYGVTPEDAARALCTYLEGRGSRCEGEVLDIDEDAYRRNILSLKLHSIVETICAPGMVGASKQPSPSTTEEEENKIAIAKYVVERFFHDCNLVILGPGTTTAAIAKVAGLPKTLLGVDIYHGRRVVKLDANEADLLRILSQHSGKRYLILSPIGGQGFILGRGNQQITPRVLRLVGLENIVVVATWSKIRRLGYCLRVDTGDPELDKRLKGYIRVIVDYNEEVVAKVE